MTPSGSRSEEGLEAAGVLWCNGILLEILRRRFRWMDMDINLTLWADTSRPSPPGLFHYPYHIVLHVVFPRTPARSGKPVLARAASLCQSAGAWQLVGSESEDLPTLPGRGRCGEIVYKMTLEGPCSSLPPPALVLGESFLLLQVLTELPWVIFLHTICKTFL